MDELAHTKDFYKAYKDLGWYYDTYDFQECQLLHNEELGRLNSILSNFDPQSKLYESIHYTNIRSQIDLPQTSTTRLIHNYGVEDLEELVKKMYFLVYDAELNTSEIALIFSKNRFTIGKLLRSFGMNITRKEARRRIEKNGRGNHTKTAVEGKKVMIARAIRNGVTGNNSENICRALIETHLYSYLNIEQFEFIVGLSSNAIISPKEVDIPIIIFNKSKQKYYRYAVELDGTVWHEKDSSGDEEKDELIKKSNWKLIRIIFHSAEKSKTKIEDGFRKMADDVCDVIVSDITNISSDWKIKVINGF